MDNLLLLVAVVLFFTPSKYLGLGGWGAYFLVLFSLNMLWFKQPFHEWTTWISGPLALVLLSVWLYKRLRIAEPRSETRRVEQSE